MTTRQRINPAALTLIRERTGLSIRQLADASGVSHSQLAALERGENQPTPSTLRKITQALAIPVTALVAIDPTTEAS